MMPDASAEIHHSEQISVFAMEMARQKKSKKVLLVERYQKS